MKILFCRGKGLLAALVRWQTWGKYSHVAIEIGGRVYEAVPFKGVRRTATYVWRQRNQADEFFIPGLRPEYEVGIENFLVGQLGKSYDWLGVLRFIPRWKSAQNNRWFCSELIAEALGIALKRISPVKVSPSMLSYSPLFEPFPTGIIPIIYRKERP